MDQCVYVCPTYRRFPDIDSVHVEDNEHICLLSKIKVATLEDGNLGRKVIRTAAKSISRTTDLRWAGSVSSTGL